MNLTQLDAAVQAQGYSFVPPLSGPADPANPILQALNSVYRKINGAERWPWLENEVVLASTTVGMNVYPLSSISDFVVIDAVRLIDPQGNQLNLDNMDPQRFKQLTWESSGQNAVPRLWTQYAGSIQLWPYPDASYQIVCDYINQPPDLAVITDVPVIPAIFHDVLVWGAVEMLAFRERNIWSQELAMGYYQDRYTSMRSAYLLRQRQTSSEVEKSGYFDDSTDDWMTYGTGAW